VPRLAAERKTMFVLIISQYYYSRHYFIVRPDESTYMQKAQSFLTELEAYKRDKNNKECTYYGDMCEKYFTGVGRRYNVNDSGDVYFIPVASVTGAVEIIKKYQDDSRREAAGFQRKAVKQAIQEHHNTTKITEIVSKYFEIV
jgi:hypothetical protein